MYTNGIRVCFGVSIPGTPNNHFLMDVWLNNHFPSKDLESSNLNNHLKIVVWSSRSVLVMSMPKTSPCKYSATAFHCAVSHRASCRGVAEVRRFFVDHVQFSFTDSSRQHNRKVVDLHRFEALRR